MRKSFDFGYCSLADPFQKTKFIAIDGEVLEHSQAMRSGFNKSLTADIHEGNIIFHIQEHEYEDGSSEDDMDDILITKRTTYIFPVKSIAKVTINSSSMAEMMVIDFVNPRNPTKSPLAFCPLDQEHGSGEMHDLHRSLNSLFIGCDIGDPLEDEEDN